MKCFTCGWTLDSPEIHYTYSYKFETLKRDWLRKKHYHKDPWLPFEFKYKFIKNYKKNPKLLKVNAIICDFCGRIYLMGPSFLVNERSDIPKFVRKK